MEIIIATLDLTRVTYGKPESETTQHLILGKSYAEIIEKLDNYVHYELTEESKETILDSLNYCRFARYECTEVEEKFDLKIHDRLEI